MEAKFMIRTKENRLFGPFSKALVAERVARGELRDADEVCSGDGYWIFLHEREESKKILGVALPHTREDIHEEVTETGTETVVVSGGASAKSGSSAPSGAGASVGTNAGASSTQGSMSDAQRAAVQEVTQKIEGLSSGANSRPETMSAFRLLLWLVAVLLGVILFRVFQLSQGA
jgi:cobalamin biosynthesis Mg chelatase CobN